MKKYYGNYIGIVIQNNDPDQAGKVKVFVPHISPTVYNQWINNSTNKSFKFMGANINSVLSQALSGGSNSQHVTSILEELKLILPWAQCAAPLIGESGSGRFNDYNNFANISDANFYSSFSQSTNSAADTPGKPGSFYEQESYRLTDAFVNASDNINRPNPLAYQYVPSTYSNRAKGSFSVPTVGSHVWVFFREGNPISPVYFATVYGVDDWSGIFESGDYPGTFENKTGANTDYNVNVETYRNKYVLNQKGGSIEIVNTDLKENLKFTHYSGSFKEFNNQANIELATKNDQKLVLNDQYETVRGFKNEYVGKSLDENILRDKYKKVGQLNADLFQQWQQTYAPIQDNKQLFEIQRTFADNVTDHLGNIVIKRNSLMQVQAGEYAPHPALDGTDIYSCVNETAVYATVSIGSGKLSISDSLINEPEIFDILPMPVIPQPIFTPGSLIAADRYVVDSQTIWGLGGPGLSTSSQDGVWTPDPNKQLLQTLIEANMSTLASIEAQLGPGGSEIINIAKHKVETIGLAVNNFGSFRYDGAGKMLTNEMLIDEFGTFVNYKESPLVEYVHVQDLPGGNYSLNVCNRFNVMVGAGGLNLKSLGSTNITGTITNIAGEQINLGSENEINIDAKTINISAEILRLRNKRQRQVYIDNSLGVNYNVIVGGGLSVEGETYLQHVTAPVEYQVTEITKLFGKLLTGLQFTANITLPGVAAGSGTVTAADATVTLTTNSNDNFVQCYDHSHIFKNLPLTLFDSNAEVRAAAAIMNTGLARATASPRWHTKK